MDRTTVIYKVISGAGSEDEIIALTQWIEQDPANRLEFDQIKSVLDSGNYMNKTIDPNASFYDGLRKIKNSIELKKRKDRKIRFYKASCSIITGLILSFVVVAYVFEWHLFSKNQGRDPVERVGRNVRSKVLTYNMKFDDVSLADLFNSVEDNYGVVISVKSKQLLSCRFTGTFCRGITLDEMMYSLSHAVGFEYSNLEQDRYEIRGKGC